MMEQEISTRQHDGTLRQRVLSGISAVLPHVLDGRKPDISEATRPMEDLDLTSTDTLEFMLELETELGIQIDVEDIGPKDLETIGTLVDYIVAHTLITE